MAEPHWIGRGDDRRDVARILRPARPRLAEAMDVAERLSRPCPSCRGTGAQQERQTCLTCDGRGFVLDSDDTGPRELWERLADADVIPAAWVQDPRRGFDGHCPACQRTDEPVRGRMCPWCYGGGIQEPHPATASACIAVASDPEGVLAAEALARETLARLRAIDQSGRFARVDAERVTWRVGAELHLVSDGDTDDALLRLSGCKLNSALRTRQNIDYEWLRSFARGADELTCSRLAVLRQCEMDYERAEPNPFEPLMDLWATTGYGLAQFREAGVVLIAPALESAR